MALAVAIEEVHPEHQGRGALWSSSSAPALQALDNPKFGDTKSGSPKVGSPKAGSRRVSQAPTPRQGLILSRPGSRGGAPLSLVEQICRLPNHGPFESRPGSQGSLLPADSAVGSTTSTPRGMIASFFSRPPTRPVTPAGPDASCAFPTKLAGLEEAAGADRCLLFPTSKSQATSKLPSKHGWLGEPAWQTASTMSASSSSTAWLQDSVGFADVQWHRRPWRIDSAPGSVQEASTRCSSVPKRFPVRQPKPCSTPGIPSRPGTPGSPGGLTQFSRGARRPTPAHVRGDEVLMLGAARVSKDAPRRSKFGELFEGNSTHLLSCALGLSECNHERVDTFNASPVNGDLEKAKSKRLRDSLCVEW